MNAEQRRNLLAEIDRGTEAEAAALSLHIEDVEKFRAQVARDTAAHANTIHAHCEAIAKQIAEDLMSWQASVDEVLKSHLKLLSAQLAALRGGKLKSSEADWPDADPGDDDNATVYASGSSLTLAPPTPDT